MATINGLDKMSYAELLKLQGRRRDQPYKSGESKHWIKVKTATWREANRDRWELFQR